MTMISGSVLVDDDGDVTKSGMAGALYDSLILTVTDADGEIPDGEDGAPMKKSIGSLATRIAQGIVPYITSNAVVTGLATIAVGGLQRDPVSPNDDTLSPTVTKTIPTSGTIS